MAKPVTRAPRKLNILAATWAVLLFAGCLQTTITGNGDGGDAGTVKDAGNGADAGADGGPADGGTRDAGTVDAGPFDAGTCLIGGEVLQAGEWQSLGVGSCIACDPSVSATSWTTLPVGAPCEGFVPSEAPLPPDGGLSVILAACLRAGAYFGCTADGPGSDCGGDEVGTCLGGFCNDAGPWGTPDVYATGWCEITENFGGGISLCGYAAPIPPNICAEGPCCLDAGPSNSLFPNGVGWCCGLPDGGAPPCLPSGSVCYETSNCCGGLACTGHDGIADSDGGFGFCR